MPGTASALSRPTFHIGKRPGSFGDRVGRPAVVANTPICLIHQANYLLDRQIAGLERQFIQEEGGYSERLHAARLQERQKQDPTDPSDRTDRSDQKPSPACAKPMVLRMARKGHNVGSQFWGCSGYPECKAIIPVQT